MDFGNVITPFFKAKYNVAQNDYTKFYLVPPVVRVFALWSQAKFCATIFSHNVKFCLNGENWYFNFVSHKTMSNYDAYMCTNAEDHLVEYNSFHF